MFIPIPIGAKNTAIVRGTVWKVVYCAGCEQPYAYQMMLEATGDDLNVLFLDGEGSVQRAQAKAEHNLTQKSRNCVIPIPCPNCGLYQDEMAKRLKDEVSINLPQVVGGLITLLAIIPLVFDWVQDLALLLIVAVAGMSLMTYGFVQAFRFDPNDGDPEPRKEIGRNNSVSGEELAKLLKESRIADGEDPSRFLLITGPTEIRKRSFHLDIPMD